MKYLIPFLLLSTSALAQQQSGPCDTKEKIHEVLTKQYGDSPSSDQKTTLILVESQMNGEINSLEELKLQLEKFRKELDDKL